MVAGLARPAAEAAIVFCWKRRPLVHKIYTNVSDMIASSNVCYTWDDFGSQFSADLLKPAILLFLLRLRHPVIALLDG